MVDHVHHPCTNAPGEQCRIRTKLCSHKTRVSAGTGTIQHSPSHLSPTKVFFAPVAPTCRQFQDLTILSGRNHLISSLSLFRAKFMPTCSYANIALGFK